MGTVITIGRCEEGVKKPGNLIPAIAPLPARLNPNRGPAAADVTLTGRETAGMIRQLTF